MLIPRHVLRNCTVYMTRAEEGSKLGQANEMQTPRVNLRYESSQNAGMVGEYPMLMGAEFEDADVKMTAFDPQAIGLLGAGGVGGSRPFLFVGDFRDEDGTKHQGIYTVRGQLSQFDPDNWQPGQPASHGYTVKPISGKLEYDDRVLIDWSYFHLRVNGVEIFDNRSQLLAV